MKELIQKYLEGSASEAENRILLEWLRKKENRKDFLRFKSEWSKSLGDNWTGEDSRSSWERVQTLLLQKSYDGWQKSIRLQSVFRYAAILLTVVVLSGLTWLLSTKSRVIPETWSTVIADRGQISRVELPDGTRVWLNSGSEISYSNRFGGVSRIVSVAGEAFFDVTENHKVPFLVRCGELQVKVLGTQFNVQAMPNSGKIEVVLEKGTVELMHSNTGTLNCRLRPGEMASFNTQNRKVTVSEVNSTRYTSWKEGILNIYNQPLAELVKKLEIRYNQPFEVSKDAENLRYTFTIKNEALGDILQLMTRITPLKAIQKGNKIYLEMDKTRKKITG